LRCFDGPFSDFLQDQISQEEQSNMVRPKMHFDAFGGKLVMHNVDSGMVDHDIEFWGQIKDFLSSCPY
jgi:hypothetical protein